jgi:hypothetical protein
MLASQLIDSAAIILQDVTNVRWPRPELLAWLNQAQLQIAMIRPDASVANQNITLVAGTKQSIPAPGLHLLDIVRNNNGAAIRLVSREVLDSFSTGWHAAAPSTKIKHYTIDQRDPSVFYVYPAAVAGTIVEGVYSIPPADCATEAAPIFSNIYASPILDWMLYRSYLKDSEFANDLAKADGYMNKFMTMLGVKTQTDLSFDPAKSQSNLIRPNSR